MQRLFIDEVKIHVKGGDGGNGIVSFRREKFVPAGGPDGGDGGRGGDVVFVVDEGLRTLLDFRHQRHLKAGRGEHGKGSNMHGKNGEDLVVRVPPGTIVRVESSGEILADLVKAGQSAVVARGGRGGRGNPRFVTPTNQAPRLAERGEPGEERWVVLELRLLADVGLVGFPNAGKSTLLARVTAARPKIADYPFTTLTPNLGVVRAADGQNFVLADIPGLIEGAHQGAGLGHEFLRHIERTRVLIHVLDVAGLGRDPLEDFRAVNDELRLYNQALARRPQLVAANKIDLAEARANLPRVTGTLEEMGYDVYPISAATGEGVDDLLRAAARALATAPEPAPIQAGAVFPAEPDDALSVRREGDVYVVSGRRIERLVAMTDLDSEEGLRHLQRRLSRLGVEEALQAAGIKPGSTVRIRGVEFIYQDGPIMQIGE